MLTPKMMQFGPPVETAAKPLGRRRVRRFVATSLKGLLCILLFAQLAETSSFEAPKTNTSPKRSSHAQQYVAGGTRWLDSRHDEVVHFICQGGAPYTISLDSASLREARVATADHPRFLGALRAAVSDWSALMGCNRFRVEMDSPYPNTRIYFTPIETPGTLATATRAGDVTLNVRRDWFPGSKRHGNYGPSHRMVSFYWVVAHELGHVWGLAHSTSPDALMYPSQCRTCRWSSFEQAAGNVIRASSSTPAWSRPHYANRFFAKTPRSVVGRLLKGDLPEETSRAGAPSTCESQTCAADPTSRDTPPSDGCGVNESPHEVALLGWLPFRLPGALEQGRSSRLERPVTGSPVHRRSQDRDLPKPPGPGELVAVLVPFDPGRSRWTDDSDRTR
jgi:Matrixin